jgi:hypothetical protein
MKKHLGISAALVLAAGTLSACGSSTDDYCDSLEDAQSTFSSIEGDDVAGIGDAVDTLRDIGDQAPDEVSDDWEVLIGTFDEMESALEDAGLSFDDLEQLQTGELPEGVEPADLEGLNETFSSLSDEGVEEAGNNIETHADEECGIQLGE